MKIKKFIFMSLIFLMVLVQTQQTFSQENIQEDTLHDLIVDYINVLKEKNVMGQTDDGRRAEPGVIVDSTNFIYLPQGITINLPITVEADALVKAIGNKCYVYMFGLMEWEVYYDAAKKIIVFRDTGK